MDDDFEHRYQWYLDMLRDARTPSLSNWEAVER